MREITAAEAASYAGGVSFCGPADNIAVTVERDSRSDRGEEHLCRTSGAEK